MLRALNWVDCAARHTLEGGAKCCIGEVARSPTLAVPESLRKKYIASIADDEKVQDFVHVVRRLHAPSGN